MRSLRALVVVIPLLLVWTFVFTSGAQAQDGSGITSPAANADVSGTVSVQGVAVHPTFRKWQLDLLIDGDERQAHFLAVGDQPVSPAATLATIDSTQYHDGNHALRLRVVYVGLNYDEYVTPIRINNGGGAASATAVATSEDQPAAGEEAKQEAAKPAEPAPVVFRTDAPADGKKWIEIDISDQHLTAWQGDVPVFETTVSTGKPGYRTLPGVFHVYRKYEQTRMRGVDYDTPDVPWTMYYSGGFAIHGAYWHNNFGTPVSHGCVNLRVPESKALYEWAPMGTEVVVNP
ncbi:MAG: L,D-transpeptidase [Caldilineaceae bacterium]